MAKKRNVQDLDAPQLHADHRRPVTRRDFLGQGFIGGSAFALSGGVMSLFSNPRDAYAALPSDLQPLLANPCNIATVGAGKIPFIAFDPKDTPTTRAATVAFTVATCGINTPGTVYRMDDVPLPLRPAFESPHPSDFDILSKLEVRVKELMLTRN